MTPVGTAIVGIGYWGPGIVRNLAGLESCRLLHLVDQDASKAAGAAERFCPDTPAHDDYTRVLNDPAVEAIVIATPVRSHHELALGALRAGKHVLVEKPLAMTVPECKELEAEAAARNLTLMVGHIFLFNAAVEQVKTYIDEGKLGEVLYVHSRRVNLGRVQGDINALWSFAPHDLSILNYWLGSEPVAVAARGFSYISPGVEDVVFCTLHYPGKVRAHIHIGWLDPRKVREMTVVGDKRMVVFDDISPGAKVQLFDSRVETSNTGPEDFAAWQVDIQKGDVSIPKIAWVEPLRTEMAHFLGCVRGDGPCRTDGASGTSVTASIVAAQESLRRDGALVSLAEVSEG
ncbi:MAG: Gfo/Idh/MocA family oxidoreductase [Proteobacteria bacterium]|nr:Gfo/Idh/MocA family oxidoreductase [Pseudomonadota bacterium]